MKVEYIDHMGDDLAVANTARVSFAKWVEEFTTIKDKEKGSDEGLIKYLAEHNHWTPFSHAFIKLRVGAPVPIRTQCFKHKVGLTENEESRRYISSKPEIYIPDHFRCKPEGSAKQGSGDVHPESVLWRNCYISQVEVAVRLYTEMIEDGVCAEQARFVLPQGAMVNWIWTGSLMAYARMYKQRTHHHAQKEVREIAKMVGDIIEPLYPYSWKYLIK